MRQIEENMKAYGEGNRTKVEKETLAEFNDWYTKYLAARPHWFELIDQGKHEEAHEYRAETTNTFAPNAVKTLGKLITTQNELGDAKRAQVNTEANTSLQMIRVLAVAGHSSGPGDGVHCHAERDLACDRAGQTSVRTGIGRRRHD